MTARGDDILAQLLQGNERYRSGRSTRTGGRPGLIDHRPRAAVLTCSDARVSPESVFDVDPGVLFTVRTAGQTVGAAAMGTLEYAIGRLRTPVLLILGHSHCGAIEVARGVLHGDEAPTGALGEIISRIVAEGEQLPVPDGGRLDAKALTDHHLRETRASLLTDSATIAEAARAGRLDARIALLRLDDGRVSLL